MDLLLDIAGTPYSWILTDDLPSLKFADFNSVITVILGVCANGAMALIALILVLELAKATELTTAELLACVEQGQKRKTRRKYGICFMRIRMQPTNPCG